MTARRTTRRNLNRKPTRRLSHQSLERRELLAAEVGGLNEAPRLIAVAANSGENFDLDDNNVLPVAPTELTFRFDGGQELDPDTFDAFRFVGAGGDGSFNEGNEYSVTPGFLGFADRQGTRIIVARFAETLPDDQYQIRIAGFDDTNAGIVGLRNVDGDLFHPADAENAERPVEEILFEVEVGPRVVAVVPQPVEGSAGSRVQRRDQIHVYFNDDPLSNPAAGAISSSSSSLPVVTPEFYKLIYTGDTVENVDDQLSTPTLVQYDPALNRAVLTFADDLSELVPDGGGAGTFRLRVGSSDALPAAPSKVTANETGDLFSDENSLGDFGGGTESVVVTDGMIRSTRDVIPQWPGASDAVGLRQNRRDAQIVGRVDTNTGINVYAYNFANLYGLDPQLNQLDNAITDAQKQRVREVLDLYSERLGVQFVETEDSGLQIVTGDLRAIVQTADTGSGTPYSSFRVNEADPSRGVLVLDAGENWFDGYGLSPDTRPSYFVEAIRGVGSLLGIGDLFELPEGVGAGGSSPDEPNSVLFSDFFPDLPVEPEFLSQSDLAIGRALHRPESSDIDFYSFDVSDQGRITVETFAQRLDGSSLLDTNLNLYQEIDGEFELIARNDDFYSDDSFVGVEVEPGKYMIGVSASGNDTYDGNVDGSGIGGVTEGRYELRVTFNPTTGATITDTTGTRLDGDADGIAGGDFNFWFRVARDASVATGDEARTIFVDKTLVGDDANDGSIDSPVHTVAEAFRRSRPGDVVRLLPNGGVDGVVTTPADNFAYEFGFGGTGDRALEDGGTFEVPRGVTVMVDAGAILKLRNAKISVGSETVDEDRSLAALQVLGTPMPEDDAGNSLLQNAGSVLFTSYNDEGTGVDTNPLPTSPQPGDWAGIEFRNDFDLSEGRPVWENEGIFLDYVSHANMRFGGGTVDPTDANEPVVTPLEMNESRPTLIYNTITQSADAAISADPNSFRETNFHSPVFQRVASFTSDYTRVGPELSGNRLIGNSINGLFVRVATPAGGQLEPMTVSGRMDDTDIVHVFSEVLVLQGQPGGPQLLQRRPTVANVTLQGRAGGDLSDGTYDYRVTFVTVEGSESLASVPTRQITLAGGTAGSVALQNLPVTPQQFAGRRLYRLDPTTGDYVFVTQLDRGTTTFVDDGTTRGGILRSQLRPDISGVALQNVNGGTLVNGRAYDYRITFVDGVGGESLASDATSMIVADDGGAVRISGIPQAPSDFVGRMIYRRDPFSGRYERVAELDADSTSYIDRGGNIPGLLGDDGNEGALLLPRFDARLSIDPGLVAKMQSARIESSFGADFYAEGADGQKIVFTSRLDDSYGAGGTFDTNNDGIADNASPGDWGGLVFRQDATGSLDHVELRFAGGTTPIEGGFTEFNPVEILQADVRITNSSLLDNASGFLNASQRGGRGFNDASVIFVRGSQPVLLQNSIAGNEGAAISINPDALNHDDLIDYGRSTGRLGLIETDQDNVGPLISGNRLENNLLNGMRVRSELVTTDSVWDDTDIVHIVDGEIVSMTNHFHGAIRLKSDANQSLVVKFGPNGTLIGDGRPLDINDRIGGTLQVLGQGGFPVILTSLADDSVGAGFTPSGIAQTNTDNVDSTPSPGDWIGLQLRSYINDRNVAYVIESERAISAANAENASADDAQVVGDLAPDEFAGDETKRLGFNIHGTLSDPTDQDVYRFSARGGTEVFIDIDQTTFGLDTVVELIDVNDNVLASSDDSFAEITDRSTLFRSASLAADSVQPLYQVGDGNVESPNPLDAGMRVILPGSSNSDNLYFVRVRSEAQETSGQYLLSIRLREADEVAGSTVQLADIRYATDGIRVSDAPLHSPLVGDINERLQYTAGGVEFESNNNNLSFTNGDAERAGNLLTSDRGSLIISGEIGNLNPSIVGEARLNDLDVYQVDLFNQQIEPDVFDSENRFVTTTFDIDYADGLGRVNTSLAVYNSAGQLVLHSRDSNVADDVGRPRRGEDSSNLEGGSVGVTDAHIGPVEMPEGTYYVVVSSAVAVPDALDQFFEEDPTDTDVRLMPINSLRRIADDGLESFFFVDQDLQYAAERAIIEPIFNNSSIVDYSLEDIRLFVSFDGGISGNNRSTIASINPLTGVLERLIGQFGPEHRDIAMRDDGEIYTYSTAPQTGNESGGNVGNYLNISPIDAGITQDGDDSLTFFRNNQQGDGNEADTFQNSDDAVLDFEAIAFPLNEAGFGSRFSNGGVNNTTPVNNNERFFAVGHRDVNGRGTVPGVLRDNILYQMQTSTGLATNRGGLGDDIDYQGAPYNTAFGPFGNRGEFGIIDTGNIFDTGGDGGRVTGLAFVPNAGNQLIAATDRGGIHLVNPFVSRPAPGGTAAAGYGDVIPTTYYGQVPVDANHAATGANSVRLQSIAFGPRNVDGQAFRQVIFGVTTDGWLYAFTIQNDRIVPAHLFQDGRAAVPLTSEFGGGPGRTPVGIAFSTLENSPWHFTNDRFEDDGHGMFAPFDQSKQRTTLGGGDSLFFGFEPTGDQADNVIERPDGSNLGSLAPGGSHGSIVSQSINLAEYASADKPTLYFTYFMDVEAEDDYVPTVRRQNDSLRVFASGDDGQWQLLGTNNDFRDLAFGDEYDYFFDDTEIPVQELFDDTGWRQARVDLSPLAGNENVKLRFDFSTAGSMRKHFDSVELIGVAGNRVPDRSSFQLGSTTFENLVGVDLFVPNGSALQTGDRFQVTGPDSDGTQRTFTFTFTESPGTSSDPLEIFFESDDTRQEVADKLVLTIPKTLRGYSDGNGRVSLLAANQLQVLGGAPIAQSNAVQVRTSINRIVTPRGADLFEGESILINGPGGTQTLTYSRTVDGPDTIFFTESSTPAQLANQIVQKTRDTFGAFVSSPGIVGFAKSVTISLNGTPSENAVSARPVSESRFNIVLPQDSADINDGEQLTLTRGTDSVVITFVDSEDPIGGPFVHYQGGTPQAVVAQRLWDAIPFEFRAVLEEVPFAPDEVSVVADSVTRDDPGTNIIASPLAAQNVTVPSGDQLTDGQTLQVSHSSGASIITFIESTVDGPVGTVRFQSGDSGTQIGNRLAAALNALNAPIDSVANGPAVAIYGSISATASGAIGTSSLDAQQAIMPAGSALNDGETIVLTDGGVTETITFVASATPAGPGTVHFEPSTTAAQVASRLQAAISGSFGAVISSTNPRAVRLSAESLVAGTPDSNIGIQSITFSRTVRHLDVANGDQLRHGEQIFVQRSNGNNEIITFVKRGLPSPAPGTNEIFFDEGDTDVDLYFQIVDTFGPDLQVYVDPSDDGINFAESGIQLFLGTPQIFTQTDGALLDTNAVPITLPAGSEIVPGETITVVPKDGGQQTFQFVLDDGSAVGANQVAYLASDSAEDVATKLLNKLPLSLQAFLQGPREIFVLNATRVRTNFNSAIVGFDTVNPNAVPVVINSTMTSEQVAERVQTALVDGLGRFAYSGGEIFATPQQYTRYAGDRIRIFDWNVVDPGPYGLHDTDFFDTAMPGDEFGETRSPSYFGTNSIRTEGAANNNVEGVYVDDIIIGFAERGEMVINAPGGNRGFTLNPETLPDTHSQAVQPERQNETLTGGYSLEIRTSDEYGVPQDYNPINLILDETGGLGRSFDTNDRLADGAVTLITQAGQYLLDGDTFVLYDGTRSLTFEFDSQLEPGVATGNVRVPFDPRGDDARDIAAAVRQAINSPESQDVLDIVASTGDSRETGFSTSNRVELFGPAITVNPGGGRFIKLDLVAEETFQGRETALQIPVVDHDRRSVDYTIVGDDPDNASVSGFVDGRVDTVVAVGKIGDAVVTGERAADGALVLPTVPGADVDTVRIYLQAGHTVDIDVDTFGFTKAARVLTNPLIQVLNTDEETVASSLLSNAQAPGESEAGAFLKFTAPEDGFYDVAISSSNFSFGEYQLTIRPDAAANDQIPSRDVLMVDYQFGQGDKNRVREQGQIVISSNFISHSSGYGVSAEAGDRGQAFASDGNAITPDETPRPGSVRLLRNQNTDDLLPGTVISNNVIFGSGSGGILFAGGTANDGETPAPVPFARIFNNTVVGDGTGSGIKVESSASPTLLNNVVAGFETGIDVDSSSQAAGTVTGGNAFQNNGTDSTLPLATSSIVIPDNVDLFADASRNLYIPAAGSQVIDSSFASLPDRGEFFQTVKNPMGIAPSPIIAPSRDAYGQPRIDDPTVTTPGGVGSNVFIDRGAIDRADKTRPVAVLTAPQDAIGSAVVGGDGDPDESFVRLTEGTVDFFEIQILDPSGTGPDISTITEETVLLTENGRRLVPDLDYTFGYSDNSRTIRLTPLAGLWRPDAVYEITLNNQRRISYQTPAGDEIVDGDQVTITDGNGTQTVFEYDSGLTVLVPQTTLFTVLATNTAFRDRDTFTIQSPVDDDGNRNSLTFEINLVGSTAPSNIPINLAGAGTIGEVRDAILAVLSGPHSGGGTIAEFLNLQPRAVGPDRIQLGTLSGHTVNAGGVAGLDVSGQLGGVADGGTFTLTVDDETATFEFTTDNDVEDGNVAVPFSRTDTPDEIAESIAAAAAASDLDLTQAQAIGDGGLFLGRDADAMLDLGSSTLQQTGAAGVDGPLTMTVPDGTTGADIAGTTFEIDVDGRTVTFEYTLDPTQTSPNELILVEDADEAEAIAQATVGRIAAAFPDKLSPSSSGGAIMLGEQSAIPPAGEDPSLATVDPLTSGLQVSGVSGGAVAVEFLPTSQFSELLAAARLQAAIGDSPLEVTTFSPGGGIVLIRGAESLEGRIDGSDVGGLGTVVPAVTDLTGNPIRETRTNNETRFTVIMPEVEFDFGDAPESYGTLVDDNGARHTVSGERTPRLGEVLDTEDDANPFPGSDDALTSISASETGGVFLVDSTDPNRVTVGVTSGIIAGGETLTLTLGGASTTFELVDAASNPTPGNVPIIFTDSDSPEDVASRLAAAIRPRLADAGGSVVVSQDSSDPSSLIISSVDDEDGVSIGRFVSGVGDEFFVFAEPGAPIDNLAAEDIAGFLNPLQTSPTRIPVQVTGSGLLDVWVDFDQNGTFEADEQVVDSEAVVDGLNMIEAITPANALDGLTWARFRISETGNLNPTGVAVGGEVEDYQISVISVPGAEADPRDDQVVTSRNNAVDIDVAANDDGFDGTSSTGNFEFVSQPNRGTAELLPSGEVRYTPQTDFIGVDTFSYLIRDQLGRPSDVATVGIRVVSSFGQNPSTSEDVDADTNVTAIDALLIINKLTRDLGSGDTSLPVNPNASTPPFYDVDGNQRISPLDALQVINALIRARTMSTLGSGEGESSVLIGSGEGESSEPIAVLQSKTDDAASYWDESAVPPLEAEPKKVVAGPAEEDTRIDPVGDDVLDLISSDREQSEQDDKLSAAVDAALAHLL